MKYIKDKASDFTMNNPDARRFLDYAKTILGRRKQTLEDLQGKRIRVVRAYVFEGEAAVVMKQLSLSLPEGVHSRPILQGFDAIEITVVQDDIKIID